MEYMLKIQEFKKYFETVDFIDVKVFEGDTTLEDLLHLYCHTIHGGSLCFNPL
jgi:hypothetical protein